MTRRLSILRRSQTATDRATSALLRSAEATIPAGIVQSLTRQVSGVHATSTFPVSIYFVVGVKQNETAAGRAAAAVFVIGVGGANSQTEFASGVNGEGQTPTQLTPLAWMPVFGTAVSIVPDGVQHVTWRFTTDTCQPEHASAGQTATTAARCRPSSGLRIIRASVRDNLASAPVNDVGYLQSATWYGARGVIASASEPAGRSRGNPRHARWPPRAARSFWAVSREGSARAVRELAAVHR